MPRRFSSRVSRLETLVLRGAVLQELDDESVDGLTHPVRLGCELLVKRWRHPESELPAVLPKNQWLRRSLTVCCHVAEHRVHDETPASRRM